MPLRAVQLFVRARSLDELGEALGRALQRTPRPAAGADRTVLALQSEGWGTVVLERPEPQLAGHLSEGLGLTLALELDGGRLALSMCSWEAGAPGEEERDPHPPRFRDVEVVAWELLQYLGVPPALRLLRAGSVELREDARDAPLVVFAKATAEKVELWTLPALPPERAEGLFPPVDPDVVVESRAGEARALEVRELPPGIPTAIWATALAAIEEAQSLRLLRTLADGEEERVARPTFAYRSPQALRLEKLLTRARAARPWLARLLDPERPPPLSRAGFTALCRARLDQDLPEARIARAHGTHLELQLGAACLRAPLGTAFDLYLADLDEEAATGRVLAAARTATSGPVPEVARWDRERALAGLLPTLLTGEPGERAALPAAEGLWGALLCDDGERIAPVSSKDLDALGVSPEEAFERALANADALTERAPEAVRWFDLEHGRVVTCEFNDPGGAGRLLSPAARELILQVLGAERAFAIAPTRDALLACDAEDAEGTRLLAREARQRFDDGPFPLTPLPWLLTADAVEAAAAPPEEPSGEQDPDAQDEAPEESP